MGFERQWLQTSSNLHLGYRQQRLLLRSLQKHVGLCKEYMVKSQPGTLMPNQLPFNIKIALKLRLDSKKRFKWSEIFLKIYYVLPEGEE